MGEPVRDLDSFDSGHTFNKFLSYGKSLSNFPTHSAGFPGFEVLSHHASTCQLNINLGPDLKVHPNWWTSTITHDLGPTLVCLVIKCLGILKLLFLKVAKNGGTKVNIKMIQSPPVKFNLIDHELILSIKLNFIGGPQMFYT